MPIIRRASAIVSVALAVMVSGALPLVAQEPATSKTTAPVAKKKNEPSRRVPDGFGRIALTPEQRASIYAVQDKHLSKIEALEKQIETHKAEMLAECEGVLDDTQKKLLANLRRSAEAGAKPADAAKAPK